MNMRKTFREKHGLATTTLCLMMLIFTIVYLLMSLGLGLDSIKNYFNPYHMPVAVSNFTLWSLLSLIYMGIGILLGLPAIICNVIFKRKRS